MLKDDLNGWQVILASSSPRRKELLRNLGLDFIQINLPYTETYPGGLNRNDTALYLAGQKADMVKRELKERQLAITADTIVWADNRVLGKPGDREEAVKMLEELSGNRHFVITGVCVLSLDKRTCFVAETEVVFSKMEREEIIHYIDTFKPYDKAGGYGIQEWIGYIGVEEITGSYFNVMGLPVQRLYNELKEFVKEH